MWTAKTLDWSDWADAQADPSLRWVHMPFCRFCHALVQILVRLINTLFTLNPCPAEPGYTLPLQTVQIQRPTDLEEANWSGSALSAIKYY